MSLSDSVMKEKFIFIVIAVLLLVACSSKEEAHQHDSYTCPMHPTVVSDKPGACPVCGMDLVRKARPGEEVKVNKDLRSLIESPNEAIVSNAETIKGIFAKRDITIHVEGIVTYDTRYAYTIPTRFAGRLEKVLLKYSYHPVRKGQKVVEIYSPELVTAQREYLYLLNNDAGNADFIEGAKQKLLLFGMTPAQIARLKSEEDVSYTFPVFSNHEGYVVSLDQKAPSYTSSASTPATSGNGSGMSGMGGGQQQSTSSPSGMQQEQSQSASLIREGDYVQKGQTLFKVVSSKALRVELNLPVALAGTIRKGDAVHLDFSNMHSSRATVDFVQPFFSDGEEFVKLRVYMENMQDMHIGHLVEATINVGTTEALWLPKNAVLDLGLEKVVFIHKDNVFRPVTVTTGISDGDTIEIKKGLASADEVAANAQFLVDSESFIKAEQTK
jgi:membrane fusion protein, copper/silver efflux system